MKKLLLLFSVLLSSYSIAQTQIGSNILGEFPGDQAGMSVSISGNGNFVAIGADRNDGGGFDSGHVRVYEDVNGVWTQVGTDVNGSNMNDFFGTSVSISDDGSTFAVGAIGKDDNGSFSGQVQVYRFINNNWTQIGQNLNGELFEDRFGSALSISADGNIVAIGAALNDGNGSSAGHVRVYEYDGSSWNQIGSDIDGDDSNDRFGNTVSLSADGTSVAIGASGYSGTGNFPLGQVRVFTNSGGTWTQKGNNIDPEFAQTGFAFSVAMSSDGNYLAVGAPVSFLGGEVFVYKFENDIWTQIGDNIGADTGGEDFGSSVSISDDGTIVAVGAPDAAQNGNFSGKVQVFQNINNTWTKIGSDLNGDAANDFFGMAISSSLNGTRVAIGAARNDQNGTIAGLVKVFDISAVLSTSDEEIASLTFYPNPTNDEFTVQLKPGVQLNEVSIYNQLGQLVKVSNKAITSVYDLSAGIYFVEIHTDQGSSSQKLIIQ